MKPETARLAFYALFTVSGFSGLIYESIWSHYLKLFLGHAAYAQSLVLATFMGGMAAGSWLASRYSRRWPNLLLAYAFAEGAIGLLGVVFHRLFVVTTDLAYETVLPALGSPAIATAVQWSLSAGLILPQSVLLGMTFPLVAGGVIRLFPDRSGGTIAMLYFTNSLGASAGVLASGFLLIERVGLPGTILTAGLLNVALAVVVWAMVRAGHAPDARSLAPAPRSPARSRAYALFLAIALLTGAASFIYEIVWIRMLSMVFGSSTHAFELMLSAFILGLALGGLWIRRRIDAIALPERFLGGIQVVMGLAALATLAIYDRSFAMMSWLLSAVNRSDAGYAVFNLSSHLIALAVMLPAAFCAGMTLPLITHCLLRQGSGERAIGGVYAANTVGAIAGVLATVHLGLPLLGLKGSLVAGAGIDIGLGLVLLWRVAGARAPAAAATLVGLAGLGGALALGTLDPYKMSSGVFRHGRTLDPARSQVEYLRDGKTATISLVRTGERLSIATNGKPDAAINVSGSGGPSPDEPAQILSALLPLAAHPQPRTAANIGFGSGATTHVLLGAASLSAVDSIEIEPFMVEAARAFRPYNERAYSDRRSRIYYEDAKTFFSLHDRRYDIIISEPSNPWVSGTASLFTEEFYARVRRHLNEGGVFAQWLQMYEINEALVASVLKALARHFPEYELYAATDFDFIVLARAGGGLEVVPERVLREPGLASALERIAIRSAGDLLLHRIATRRAIGPWVDAIGVPPNSDFFPLLEFRAPRARFSAQYVPLAHGLALAPVPVLEMLDGRAAVAGATTSAERTWLNKAFRREAALAMVAHLVHRGPEVPERLPESVMNELRLVRLLLVECARPEAVAQAGPALHTVVRIVVPVLTPEELRPLWDRLDSAACRDRLPATERGWIELYRAVGERDAVRIGELAGRMLESDDPIGRERTEYALAAALAAALAQGDRRRAAALWDTHGARHRRPSLELEFLRRHLQSSGDVRRIVTG